jgi:hypothetical protein
MMARTTSHSQSPNFVAIMDENGMHKNPNCNGPYYHLKTFNFEYGDPKFLTFLTPQTTVLLKKLLVCSASEEIPFMESKGPLQHS